MYGGYGQRGCERIEIGLRAEKAGRRGRGQRGTRGGEMGVMKEHQWQILSISSCCVKEQDDLWLIIVHFWDVTALNTTKKGQLTG